MKNAKRLMTLKEVKEQVGDKRYKEMEDIYESIKRRTIPVLPQALVRRSSILKDNLTTALYMAIKQQEKREQEAGYTSDSALLGGWRENLECLENGYALKIKYD